MLTPSAISCLGASYSLPWETRLEWQWLVHKNIHTHTYTHLIITNGHTGVKEISNLNEMEVTNRLTLLHFGCAAIIGLFNQCLNLLNLCHRQGLK